MTDPTRIRALATGDKTTVRVLMAHEMESGQRRDSGGKTIAAWHISEVVARHNGKTVLTMACGPSVSKDPYLQFTLKGAKPGDKIAVSWKDSRGGTRTDEATVS
ncbi:MAG TPA: thiosulfate oxidation carrier complex protein SoxZ [Rubrivivax sp.]|nr:thiosulfate oxidation carrier complex protein SoxZ [Rubrivivax sp.]